MSQLQVTGEAKIRDIQGPVVANSGVITALDGAASQYVRGDGTLADFPTSSGGGSSVSYYLNSSVSQGTIGGVAYRELSKEPIIGAGTDIAISTTGYVASYLTDANDPDVLSIPGGNFNCEFYFSVNNNTGNPFFYAELYKYDGTTFTLLGSSVGVPEYINQGTIIAPYYFAIPVATAALALTDRLAIRIYVNVDGRTVTLHTENGHLCQVVTTLSKGMVSLNNLTDQSQFITTGTSGTNFNIVSSGDTHTFNLPVASATNTGKLSSSDWSVFNAKEPAITAGTTLQYYRGDKTFQTLDTTAVIEATNLYFTDARARLAISLTTTNTSGPATYNNTTGVLNIPDYSANTTNFVTIGTTQTITGTKTFNEAIRNESGLLLKNGVLSGLAGYTSLAGITNGLNVQLSGSSNAQSLIFQSAASYSYTFPASSGTLALASDLSSYVPTSRTLTINGETYDLSANRSWTITGITGSGTSGQVPYFDGPTSLTSEAGFIYDASTNRLGVNTSVPNATIGADAALNSGYGLLIKTGASNYNGIGIAIDSTYGNTIETAKLGTASARNLTLLNQTGFISLTEAGNLGVNILTPNFGIDIYNSTQSQLWLHNAASGLTATDGVRLALFNNLSANLRNFDGGLSLTAEGDFQIITIGAENLRVNSANGFIGIGNPASLTSLLTVNGSITQSVTSALLKTNASGTIVAAVAGTDYISGGAISGTPDYIPRFVTSTTIGNSDISQDATFVTLNSRALSAPRARLNNGYENASLTLNIGGQTYMDSRTSRLYNTFNLSSMTNYMHIYDPYSTINANGGFSIGASTSITLLPTTSIIHFDGVNSRVGIGTTAPTKTLSVNGSSYFNGTFTLAAGAGFMYDSLRFAYSNGTSVNYIYSGGSDGLYIANQADTEILMRVTNSGNVGIGTINPDVTGFGWNTLTIRGGTAAGEAGVLELQTVTTNTNGQNIGIMAFMDGSSRNAQISVQRDTSTSTSNLLFYTNGGAGIVERLKIASTGAATFSSSVNAQLLTIQNGYYLVGRNAANTAYRTLVTFDSSNKILIGQDSDITAITLGVASEAMRIISGGNVGIGTPSPTALLHLGVANAAVDGTKGVKITNPAGTTVMLECGVSSDSFVGTTSASDFSIRTGNSPRMTITSGGELQVAYSGGAGLIRSQATYTNTSANVPNMYIGSAYEFGRGTASSMRYKENINDWNESGINTILALKPKTFTYKEEYYKHPERVILGLIAEEVAEVSPYLADYENEDGSGQVENVRYSYIVVPLIKAVQELEARIKQLENK
jgi:hypothetical protein